METFLKTNEFEEAISALEMITEILPRVNYNIYHWKWVVLFFHQALQGFMVLALRGSDGLRPLKDKVALAWLQAYREGREYPREELDCFFKSLQKN